MTIVDRIGSPPRELAASAVPRDGAAPAFPLAGRAAVDELVRAGYDLRPLEDLYPLAPPQLCLLSGPLDAPSSALSIGQLACTFDGPLDAAAFAAAWQRLVDRHAALRTIFVRHRADEPLQAVLRRAELPVASEDWRGQAAGDQEARWERLLGDDRRRGFSLGGEPGGTSERTPLLRLTLVRTGERRHRLLWSFHRLLFDGSCLAPLFAELFAFYAALRAGGDEPPRLPPARPYRDFIAWLASRDEAAAEAFWCRELAGFAHPTPLPFDRPEAPAGGPGVDAATDAEDFAQRSLALPPAAAARLAALAADAQAALGTVVQCAWALLLGRYASRRDVVFGAVVSGRPTGLPGADSMVGLFSNRLPMRLRPARQPLAAWLRRAEERQWGLRHHRWTPLTRLAALSEVPAGEPLFNSLVAFESAPSDEALAARAGELSASGLTVSESTSCPLTLTVVARDGLSLRLAHDRRFDGATAQRMLGHLETLLTAMAAGLERPATELPILTAAERHQLLVEWNPPPASTAADDPAAPFPRLALYVLDAELEPVPVGAPGILYLAEGLAVGSLRDAARTAARLLPDPFGLPGGRLRRLGDRVRRLPTGALDKVRQPSSALAQALRPESAAAAPRLDLPVQGRGTLAADLDVSTADQPPARAYPAAVPSPVAHLPPSLEAVPDSGRPEDAWPERRATAAGPARKSDDEGAR